MAHTHTHTHNTHTHTHTRTHTCSKGALYGWLEGLEQPLGLTQILNWSNDIAEGMNYLHFGAPERIVHRDLKSLNVLVSQADVLKICDFGSSRSVSNASMSACNMYVQHAPPPPHSS